MRKLLIAAVVAAQIAGVAPAFAAELADHAGPAGQRQGAFAGARIRVPLGGGREKAQAGLTLTSTLRVGETGQLRFAKGAEFGFSGRGSKPGLTIAGRPLSKLTAGRSGPTGRKHGFSTTGWVVIGASAVIIIGGVLIFDYIGDQSE